MREQSQLKAVKLIHKRKHKLKHCAVCICMLQVIIRPYTPVSAPDAAGHLDLVIKAYPTGEPCSSADLTWPYTWAVTGL
jgi:hypothetical protein